MGEKSITGNAVLRSKPYRTLDVPVLRVRARLAPAGAPRARTSASPRAINRYSTFNQPPAPRQTIR